MVAPPPVHRPLVSHAWTPNDSQEANEADRLLAALGLDRIGSGKKPLEDVRRALLFTIDTDARGRVKQTLRQTFGYAMSKGRDELRDGGRFESWPEVLGALARDGVSLPSWASFLRAPAAATRASDTAAPSTPPAPRPRRPDPAPNSTGSIVAELRDFAKKLGFYFTMGDDADTWACEQRRKGDDTDRVELAKQWLRRQAGQRNDEEKGWIR